MALPRSAAFHTSMPQMVNRLGNEGDLTAGLCVEPLRPQSVPLSLRLPHCVEFNRDLRMSKGRTDDCSVASSYDATIVQPEAFDHVAPRCPDVSRAGRRARAVERRIKGLSDCPPARKSEHCRRMPLYVLACRKRDAWRQVQDLGEPLYQRRLVERVGDRERP